MNEEKKIVLDLQHVKVEQEIDKFKEMDLSKVIGNTVHQMAGDIGLDDKARELYHNGKVEVTVEMRNMIKGLVANSDLVFFIKKAVIDEIDKV